MKNESIEKRAANVIQMASDHLAGEAICAVEKAERLLATTRVEEIEKSIWGSPAGKTHLAKRIVEAIPPHRVYVEPFAGGAQVLFAKEPSEMEVVGDLDTEIAFAFRFARELTPEKLERLRRKKWIGDKDHFRRLYESPVPEDDVNRFYRFAYLTRFSFNKLRRGTMPDKNVGARSRFVERLEQFAPRLRQVKVRCADYEKVIEELDGPDTFFYLDPPYPGYDTELGNKQWDEERFNHILHQIKGKFLVTYGIRGDHERLFEGFQVQRWRHTSGVGTSRGQGLRESVTLVITNYQLRKGDVENQKASADQVADKNSAVEKTVWGSPAGKKKLADRLVAMLPAHKVYVEPFAGSAAVLFAKEPVETEVLNDADPEIAFAFRCLKKMTARQLDQLRQKDWIGRETTFHKLRTAGKTRSDLDRLYRFLYLSHFSYGKLRGKSFNRNAEGAEARTIGRIKEFAPRLKNVTVHSGDYEKVVREFDSKDTLFYLDPPYPGHDVGIGEDEFDEERFRRVLKSIKGKFLVTYGTRGKLDLTGLHIRRILPPRYIRSMSGVGGTTVLPTLLIANYMLKEKDIGRDAGGWSLIDLEKSDVEGCPVVESKLAKQDDPLLDLPKQRGKHDAVLQYHFRGKSLHTDIRLKVDGHLVGWTISNARAEAISREVNTIDEARHIARSFSLAGGRYTKSMIAPNQVMAFPKERHSSEWLNLEAEVFEAGSSGATRFEEGVIVAVDRPKVEWGIQSHLFHEYFFTDGKKLNGIMYFRLLTGQDNETEVDVEAGRRTGSGENYWTCFLSKSYLPSVLKPRAVETKTMPPDGYSAIPQTLEQVTPREYRYWLAKGKEAREIRDALVESDFFNEKNIRLVDDEFRRVVTKHYLFTGGDEVEKRLRVPFQSWGGSAKYADRLAAKLPTHQKYVEPFCGSAAVLFAKDRSEQEAIADSDPEVVFALKYIQNLTGRRLSALRRLDWTVSREGFERSRKDDNPASDAERFWRFVYGRYASWGAKRGHGYSTVHEGLTYQVDELERFRDRLKGVKIEKADWRETLRKHDGKETLFFIDPPYEGEWGHKGGIPADEIADAVSKLKGKWVVAYTNSTAACRAFGKVGRLFTLRFPEARHRGAFAKRRRLFASNCIEKLDGIVLLDEIDEPPMTPAEVMEMTLPGEVKKLVDYALEKRIPFIKTKEERYVLGIVLEPETVDAQKDIYSAKEIRAAAHGFMESFARIGLMHRTLVDGDVKILESYLAPATFDLDGTRIKKGTWLLAVRIMNDDLWIKIKRGDFTGFSIGGSASRNQDTST